jgi:hypothetical protein
MVEIAVKIIQKSVTYILKGSKQENVGKKLGGSKKKPAYIMLGGDIFLVTSCLKERSTVFPRYSRGISKHENRNHYLKLKLEFTDQIFFFFLS